jgi:hypothetical protein
MTSLGKGRGLLYFESNVRHSLWYMLRAHLYKHTKCILGLNKSVLGKVCNRSAGVLPSMGGKQ